MFTMFMNDDKFCIELEKYFNYYFMETKNLIRKILLFHQLNY